MNKSKTRQEAENMTAEQLEEFLCAKLFEAFKAFPQFKPWQQTAIVDMVRNIEYIQDPEEIPIWHRVVELFEQRMAVAQAA